MDIQEIDPTPWKFSLKETGDNRFDLTLLQTNCNRIDLETCEIAAEIALSNILGEGRKIDAILSTKLTKEFSDQSMSTFPMTELANQLKKRR